MCEIIWVMGHKAARSKGKRERDLNLIADLYVQKVPQAEIAKAVGLSQGTVSTEIKRLIEFWKEQRLDDLDKIKLEQLHRIDRMERELWEAWNKSKRSGKRTITKSKAGEFSGSVQQDKYWSAKSVEEDVIAGDMQYMHGIQWCVQERNKIIGLYAPKKLAATDPTGMFEARSSARDEILDLISTISRKALPESVDAEIIEESTDIVSASIKKLDAPIEFDTEGNILING
jgi:Helix-turn-helix domain